MSFDESEEHDLLRRAVSELAAQYGHDYYADATRRGVKTDELWNAMGVPVSAGTRSPRPPRTPLSDACGTYRSDHIKVSRIPLRPQTWRSSCPRCPSRPQPRRADRGRRVFEFSRAR